MVTRATCCVEAFGDTNRSGPDAGSSPAGRAGGGERGSLRRSFSVLRSYRTRRGSTDGIMIAALAQRSLWLTDAYFVGTPPYVQGLMSAACDGVDVRLLVPGTSDLPGVGAI